MSETIKLSPEMLISQAAQLSTLSNDFNNLFDSVVSELNTINGNWSKNLANNFAGKIVSAQNGFRSVVDALNNGSEAARICAESFENIDDVLAKMMSGGGSNGSAGATSSIIPGNIDSIEDVFDLIDEQYNKLPSSVRENIKSCAKNWFGSGVSAYEITHQLFDKDFEGAIEKFCKDIADKAGDGISEIVFSDGSPDFELGFDQKLYGKYIINSIWDGTKATKEFIDNPSMENLIQIGWNSTVGSVLDTVADEAYSFVSKIPFIGDWYAKRGATDGGSIFNVAYTEWTRAIFGDDMANSVSTYYADNGGRFKGLVNGYDVIKDAVTDSCKKSGGIINMWLDGWKIIFS